MNLIQWRAKALKQACKIRNRAERAAIYDGVQALANFPECSGVKALTRHEFSYRLRVGNWRVFFEFDGTVRIVSIEEVRKRNERTY